MAEVNNAAQAPAWKNLAVSLDFNAGVFDLERKTANGPENGWFGTTNATGKLIWKPELLANKNYGLFFQTGLWARTADLSPEYSKTILRAFAGPVAYGRVGAGPFNFRLLDAPTYFYGNDLNKPEAKTWESHEFGNYVSLAATYAPWNLSLDAHNWYVRGLDVALAGGLSAKEDGVIFGSTLGWAPFATSDTAWLKGLNVYGRFREWGWLVEPQGVDADRKWWNEITSGLEYVHAFSL